MGLFSFIDPTAIRITTPPAPAGPADVLVSSANGDALLPGGFTYVAGPPLRIAAVNPTLSLSGIPTNVPVGVLFSIPINPTTIKTSSFSLTRCNTTEQVPGSLTVDFNNTAAIFKPSTNLAANTCFALSLTQDIESAQGIPLDALLSGSFTTAGSPDTISPNVNVNPQNGATNVPQNTSIVFAFSEPINPVTVNSSTLQVSNNGQPVAGSITVGQGNRVVTFRPSTSLLANSKVEIVLSSKVTDVAGNSIVGSSGPGTNFLSNFFVGAGADLFPPGVIAVSPPDKAFGINISSSVSITFNKAIDPASIDTSNFRLSANSTNLAGTIALSGGNTVATFNPDGLLPATTQISVNVDQTVRDLNGNGLIEPFTSVFTTAGTIDNVRPLVVSLTPFNNQVDVPLNAPVVVEFSEPIAPLTINSTTLQVFFFESPFGFQQVPGAYSVSADRRVATFTPAALWVPNKSHSVFISTGVTDVAGNPLLQSVSSSFTTTLREDTKAPTVVEVSPADGFKGLPLNGRWCVQFNEPVAGPSVNGQSVSVAAGSSPVALDFSLGLLNRVVCAKRAQLLELAPSTTFVGTITPGVTDAAGNPLAAPFESVFTTGTTSDTTAPTITAVSPANGTSDVPVDTVIEVTLDEVIDPTTVHVGTFSLRDGSFFGPVVEGSFSTSADRKTLRLTPQQPLFANRFYVIQVSGVTDLAGNEVAIRAFSFRTAAAPGTDITALPTSATVEVNPQRLFANGETTALVTLSNVLRSGVVVPNGTRIGVTAAATSFDFGTVNSAGGEISGGTLSTADPRFVAVPTVGGGATLLYRSPNLEDLPPGQSRTAVIQVVSLDAADRPVQLIGSAFLTLFRGTFAQVTTNPQLLRPDGTSFAEVEVVATDNFGNPVPPGTLLAVTAEPVFALGSAGGTINGGVPSGFDARFQVFATEIDGVVKFTYTAPVLSLGVGETRTAWVQVAGVNEAGEVTGLLGVGNITLFNNGFTAPQPEVLSVSPPNGAAGVGVNVKVVAEFSQPLDPTTVTSSTFFVYQTSPVCCLTPAGTLAVGSGPRGTNTVVTFTPAGALVASAQYQLIISTEITSAAGNPLLRSVVSVFSTGAAADTQAPQVVQLNPRDGSTGVPRNSRVSVEFNEPIAALSLTPQSFVLKAGSTPVSGQVTLSSGVRGPNTIATFIPDQLLAASTSFTVILTTAVTDTAGNPLAAEFHSTFSTAATGDNIQPTVVSLTPFNSQTDIPLNAPVVVEFSEPINPLTINSTTLQVFFFENQFGFQQVPGAYSVSADGRVATFTPAAFWIPNKSHSIFISTGVQDVAGNPLLQSFSSFFTTTIRNDTQAPSVVTVSPADGFTGMPLNGRWCVQFSEPVAGPSVSSQSVSITTGGNPVVLDLSLGLLNRVVCAKRAQLFNLVPSTTFVGTMTPGVTDVASNPLAAAFHSGFTTGTTTDTTAPTITTVSPANGATTVAVDTVIEVTFDEVIDPTTVHVGTFSLRDGFFFGPVVEGSFSVSADRKTIRFTPQQPLFANRFYVIQVQGVTDLAGNEVTLRAFSFTTAVAPGTDLSTLPNSATVEVNPQQLFANGETTALVTLSNVNRSGVVVPNGTRIGVTAVATSLTFSTSAGGEISGGVVSAADPRFEVVTTVGGGATLLYRSPNLEDLPPGQTGTAVIQVVSLDTADRPVQLIGSASLTLFRGASAQVTVNPQLLRPDSACFSEVNVEASDNFGNPVPSGTLLAVTAQPVFALGSAGGTINGGVPSGSDSRFKVFTTQSDGTVQFTYTAPALSLATNESRTAWVQVAGVNEAGEVAGLLGVGNITLRNDGFCSPQPVPGGPEATGISPANGATGVGLNAVVVVEFSKPLDPATVTSSTFQVTFFESQFGFQQAPGTLTVSDGARGTNTVVTFTPTNPLAPNATHIISITTGIKSSGGDPLLRSFSSSFTTGVAADTEAPVVVQVNPADGSTAVPLNSAVTVEFNEPMAPPSLTPQSFVLKAGSTPVSGQVLVGSGVHGPNTLATFIPDAPLPANTTFTVTLTAAVTDTAGNSLAAEFMSTFATATTGDTVQPKVLSVNPANGAIGVSATTAIIATFDEPVDPVTVNSSTFKVMFFSSFFGTITIPGTLSITSGSTTATFTPQNPLFAGTNYRVELTTSIRDVAGNPLKSFFSSGFTTALAPGTSTLPIGANVLVNPPTLFANGKVPTTVTFSNIINPNGTLVSNGTRVAITAEPAFAPGAVGGVISGNSVGPSIDGRFLLFETLGAEVPAFYTPPDFTGLPSGTTKTAIVQLASVDAAGRPVNQIGQGTVTLSGIGSATVVANPTSLPANGTSTSTITVTVKDREGNPVPDGTPVGLTAAPIYSVSTAGGTIIDGATSTADPRVQIFTTMSGQLTATYRSPASRDSGTAVIQVLTVDLLDRPTSLVTTVNISLQ